MSITARPVTNFDITFTWQTNHWLALFDAHIDLIRQDIKRARAEGKLVIYLSCPISARGGGAVVTNVAIAKYTAERIQQQFGHRVWVLNPAQYQMESAEGVGLIDRHIETLGLDKAVLSHTRPEGGDYMRMWTKVLVEDEKEDVGGFFDAYYFLSPQDVAAYFKQSGASNQSAAIEDYIARQTALDPQFSATIDLPAFIKFYLLNASANFSLGCHDEWNIFIKLNAKRLQLDADPGKLLAAYFDGKQVTMDAIVASQGYAKK